MTSNTPNHTRPRNKEPLINSQADFPEKTPGIMNNQTAKRYACDRCREQKLKCPRSQPDSGTCERCLRLGAMCVTSIGRPLGRPPIHANHRGQVEDSRSLYGTRNGRPSTNRGVRVTMGTDPATTTQSQPPDPGPSQFFTTVRALDHVNTASAMWLDASNFPTAMPASDEPTIPSPRAHSHVFSELSVPDLDFGDLNDMAEHLNRDLHEPMTDVEDKVSGHSEIATPTTSNAGDTGVYVVGLLGSISHQLAELKDQPWESWNPHLTEDAFQHGKGTDSPGGRDLNVWNRILNVIMRFATVLETVNPASPPALSLTLMLLSTYVQLGELFEVVFNRMSRCLREGSGSGTSAAAPAPLSPQPTSIQLMMMTQVFEYQMHTVERLLGLPAEFRIWDRRDGAVEGGAGILSRQDTSDIVRAVMRQTRETFQTIRQSSNRIKGSAT
ncbi:hypothetical protein CORC01_08676 [Colletotrichum orchidophilum]|uniref:Zn(2)-C6 fungal-type domain-containing protein n=1 Tax=Colletotrichum orchidophilum TaxID=1209926 RepID=A0A1G4B3R4_9PEZI|nr:uncharacterized protein CORC01_08676 [Colletotrichum orchidophilum]OHE95983.1 hypothetical protein CORC01_08676 [Colletotrichum orchidophilum]